MKKKWFVIALCLMASMAAVGAEEARCKNNENCDFGLYCDKPLGKCEAKGTCEIRPEICTADYDPVCGCDGETYSNACNAARAGVSVASKGECEGNGGTTAHCLTNENCDFGLFCDKLVGECKGPGRCEVRPEVCPEIFDPVCGCDNQTYSNSCQAHRAGVSVQHQGECQ